MKVLNFQRRPVEEHSFTVGEHVQPVSPLSGLWPQSDFDNGGRVVPGHHGRQRSRHHRTVDVVRQLFESPLDVEFEHFRVHVDQYELAFTVERVFQIVERDDVRVAEHGGYITSIKMYVILKYSRV